MKKNLTGLTFCSMSLLTFQCLTPDETIIAPPNAIRASRSEIVQPLVLNSLMDYEAKEVISKTTATAYGLVFDGNSDYDGQQDPQVAVGGNYVMHATNTGLSVFDKNGKLIKATTQKCLNDGIDPKLFYDLHNNFFAIDFWSYYDDAKKKPLNVSVSATNNPTGKWYTYPISLKTAVDGGALGYSTKWMAYTYPKDNDEGGTLLFASDDAHKGKPLKVFHFDTFLGQPAFTQDAIDEIHFFDMTDEKFILRKIIIDSKGEPFVVTVWERSHQLKYVDYPLASSQKGSASKIASGDRNPKNLVIQGNSVWLAQTVNCEGYAAIQWHQLDLNTGKTIQTGIVKKANSNYIQGTIAVNKNLDVLLGFQEVNKNMFVSPSFTFRKQNDAPNTMREVTMIESGKAQLSQKNNEVTPWGDYSGSIIDGDDKTSIWSAQSIMQTKEPGCKIVKVVF